MLRHPTMRRGRLRPRLRPLRPCAVVLQRGAEVSGQTSEAFAYIEREYKDVKGRVELQRRVVEQLHMVEADAGEADAALNALLDDEASKLRILDYLRKWLGDKLEEMPANRV